MKRRVITLLLCAVLAAQLTVPSLAASTATVDEASQVVRALNIMVGDEQGNLNLSRSVTRAEFITMAVKATPQGEQVGSASTSPYPDVPYTHWCAGYVQAGVAMGLISGYLDGTFRPDNQITLAEGATIVLKLLGYTDADFPGAYPTGQLSLYRSLKLDRGVRAQEAGEVLTRQDAMYLFYNLMTTQNNQGQVYLTTLGYTLTSQGEIDLVALLNAKMEGPVVASGDWKGKLPFDPDQGVTVYRNGKTSSLSEIKTDDVVYYSQHMRTLWVYTDRVSGAIQAISPSGAQPTSVTVAGREYKIETATAAWALSDLGDYQVGDVVTLLLGRESGVAGVVSGSEAPQVSYGVVTAVETKEYPDGKGGTYTADAVTLTATDGQSYSYQWSTRYVEPGDVVEVTTDASGSTLKKVGSGGVAGLFSSDGTTLGSKTLADDVEILDSYEGSAVRVYPSRLAGASLGSGDVRLCVYNQQGEISRLILDDFTGDLHSYGMLTGVEDNSQSIMVSVNYTLVLSGRESVLSSATKYSCQVGPVQLKGSLQAVDSLKNLTGIPVDAVRSGLVLSSGQTYLLSDQVQVYEKRDGDYFLTTLDRVQDSGLELTAWYDKAPGLGGRVRVIVAQ